MEFSPEIAKQILESGIEEAQEIIKEPSKIDDLLKKLEDKLKEVPMAGDLLSQLPLMVAMVKSYITKDYEVVSPKVIALLVSSFLYFVKKKDLIPDNIPIIGYADDIAVLMLALKLCEPELQAFSEWRANH